MTAEASSRPRLVASALLPLPPLLLGLAQTPSILSTLSEILGVEKAFFATTYFFFALSASATLPLISVGGRRLLPQPADRISSSWALVGLSLFPLPAILLPIGGDWVLEDLAGPLIILASFSIGLALSLTSGRFTLPYSFPVYMMLGGSLPLIASVATRTPAIPLTYALIVGGELWFYIEAKKLLMSFLAYRLSLSRCVSAEELLEVTKLYGTADYFILLAESMGFCTERLGGRTDPFAFKICACRSH